MLLFSTKNSSFLGFQGFFKKIETKRKIFRHLGKQIFISSSVHTPLFYISVGFGIVAKNTWMWYLSKNTILCFSVKYEFGTKHCSSCSRVVFMKRFYFFLLKLFIFHGIFAAGGAYAHTRKKKRLRMLGNWEISRKPLKCLYLVASTQPSTQKPNHKKTSRKAVHIKTYFD